MTKIIIFIFSLFHVSVLLAQTDSVKTPSDSSLNLYLEYREDAEETENVFLVVEQQPSPVGGMQAFYKFIMTNIVYPTEARRMNIAGRVYVQFVIDKKGNITDVAVIKGISTTSLSVTTCIEFFDYTKCQRAANMIHQEAARVIKISPPWIPGYQKGIPVKVRMVIPISFAL